MSKLKHVAVIGAGPAGLCTLRHLLYSNANPNVVIDPVAFEQNNAVGGTWVYQDLDKDSKQEVFSSIYANLKTNLPKQVMMFPDFPYPTDVPTYLHHSLVQRYLDHFADHFNLKNHIKFNTIVEKVLPVVQQGCNNSHIKWIVHSKSESCISIEEYDAVVVCNGHYSVPVYPNIKGFENFTGEFLHSHYYRHPSNFYEKDVLLMGCGPSALDIMVELSAYCHKVCISHRSKDRIRSTLPENVRELPDVSHVNDNGQFVFEDSSVLEVDTFIPCTGYALHFPFLTKECNLNIENNTITNLYKHIFSTIYPSLSFVGLTWFNTPLPVMFQQSFYITKVISEDRFLPSFKQMMNDTDMERKERFESGELAKYFHRMRDRQWSYNRELALLSGNKENPPILEYLYNYAMKIRNEDLRNYKNREYRIIDGINFEEVSSKTES